MGEKTATDGPESNRMPRKRSFSRASRNWRRFLAEYALIVLGVLTALVLEQTAENWSWQSRADAALRDITSEFSANNGPQAYMRLVIHDCLDNRYVALREAIAAGDRGAIEVALAPIDFPARTYDDEALQAALGAGVVPHIDIDRWKHVRLMYGRIPKLDERAQAERMLLAELRALSWTTSPLDPAERLSALRTVEKLRELNNRMGTAGHWMIRHGRDAGLSIDQAALLDHRREFGVGWNGCMAVPPAGQVE